MKFWKWLKGWFCSKSIAQRNQEVLSDNLARTARSNRAIVLRYGEYRMHDIRLGYQRGNCTDVDVAKITKDFGKI